VVVNLKVGGIEETAVFVGPPPAAVRRGGCARQLMLRLLRLPGRQLSKGPFASRRLNASANVEPEKEHYPKKAAGRGEAP